ncbi:MAG: 8-oxo-dGTP diphosphatase [Lachnospiraceae bacterium]|jgi:8-oxo-dGTP diphosphatase|nr:8-oxo-dGTP diphosphatase [Lachnospiraceae bacterium]
MGHGTENVELTVLCLIQDKNKILLQNRVKEDWKGYTFPGGHVEPGESFVDAVKREMKEETGLDIIRPRLAGIKQFPIENGRYIVLLFKAEEFSGSVVSSDEGEMEWIDIEKLSEINVVEDFHELMKVLNDPDLNEFQYTVKNDEWIVHLK